MVERYDQKLEELIMDVLGTGTIGLSLFLLAKHTYGHEDMKDLMCANVCIHT